MRSRRLHDVSVGANRTQFLRFWSAKDLADLHAMSREPTIVYSADNPQQAHLLRSLLEDEGIQAWVVNDSIQLAGGELPVGWRAAAKVVVADDEAVAARQFAEAFDQKAQGHSLGTGGVEEDEVPADTSVWPRCPDCGQARNARCSICGERGSAFPSAYASGPGQGELPLFLCPSCDEPITPGWYRLCAQCGHDYGEGMEVEKRTTRVLEYRRGPWLHWGRCWS